MASLIAKAGMALAAAIVLAFPAMAPAATIEVDYAEDQFADPTPVGHDPLCSLREAVQTANTNANFDGCEREGTGTADTIVLTGGITYSRSRGAIDDTNSGGDLDITGNTTFRVGGPGYARLDGEDLDRVIQVHPGASLTASRLAITDGRVPGVLEPGSGGGGISNAGRLLLSSSTLFDNEAQRGGNGCGCGGGILTSHRMVLDRVSLSHNSATYDGGGIAVRRGETAAVRNSSVGGNSSFDGGGIYASGPLRVSSSAIFLNDARQGDGAGLKVAASDSEVVGLTNSTVSGNRATGDGGGIFRFSGRLSLNAVTLTRNIADMDGNGTGRGGGIDGGLFGPSFPQMFKFENTIVAGNLDRNPTNPKPDCRRLTGGFGSRNLIASGCPKGPTDLRTADPRLGRLADNGGPTLTHLLRAGSPATNRAGESTPAYDQRNVRRDARPDIGAYERR